MNIIPPVNGNLVATANCGVNYYTNDPTWIYFDTINPSAPGIVVGQFVTGEYVPANTKIVSIGYDPDFDKWYFIASNPCPTPDGSYYSGIPLNFYSVNNGIRYADFMRLTTRSRTSPPLTIGVEYQILQLGTTDWVALGYEGEPVVGGTFTATAAGTASTGVVAYEQIYRFSTAPSSLTISSVDAQPFSGLGQLVQVGAITRDIKSTANETTFSLTGIDTTMLSLVLSADIKGSLIEAWHGFFDSSGALLTTGGTGGLYKYFTGYINSFSISEQWMDEIRMYIGTVTVSASSIQIILRNRVAGRYTNDASWKFFNPSDTSMQRVAFISNINYAFGKTA